MRKKFEKVVKETEKFMEVFFPNFVEIVFLLLILSVLLEFLRVIKPILLSDDKRLQKMQSISIIAAGILYSRSRMHLKDYLRTEEKINIFLAILKFTLFIVVCVAICIMYK